MCNITKQTLYNVKSLAGKPARDFIFLGVFREKYEKNFTQAINSYYNLRVMYTEFSQMEFRFSPGYESSAFPCGARVKTPKTKEEIQ